MSQPAPEKEAGTPPSVEKEAGPPADAMQEEPEKKKREYKDFGHEQEAPTRELSRLSARRTASSSPLQMPKSTCPR